MNFFISAHFGHGQACLIMPTENMKINLHISKNFIHMDIIKAIAQPIAEILPIPYIAFTLHFEYVLAYLATPTKIIVINF